MPVTCVACNAAGLEPHMRVAGEMGSDGLIPTTDRFGTALADIVRCTNCGHMQLEPMPPEEVLESAYADAVSGDYVDEEAGQRETARRILDRIGPHLSREPARLLDLGCWVGFLPAEAEARGWWSVIPTHVQYFTRGSIATLLRRHGWTPLVVGTSPKAFSVRYYLERIGGYSKPVADGFVRAAEGTGVADRMWAPDFRDRMLVI